MFYIILQINDLYIQAQKNKWKNNRINVERAQKMALVDQEFSVQV